VLRPGEEKNVQLQIQGNADLQSDAILGATSDYGKNNVQLQFFPSNKTSIPASGSGTYSLLLKANNRGGETFNNNKSVSIVESSNLTLTVLPPYTTPELLTNFTETWITPISGIWTFIAGVGTVVAPLLLYLYRKRKRKDP
jgi:hypothetical protein